MKDRQGQKYLKQGKVTPWKSYSLNVQVPSTDDSLDAVRFTELTTAVRS